MEYFFRRIPLLFHGLFDVVVKNTGKNNGSPDKGKLSELFTIEDGHQQRIQNRLQSVDDGRRKRIDILRSCRKEDIGESYLHCPEKENRKQNGRGKIRFLQYKR